ncbi:DNA-processing protein DprA [Desulfitibacter alkalitolerans]|uniref:DNA-processing protein DprA n=1 Tax=Desulfitibacter alkalitolerans TaxID=264641 RepID=UPI000484C736|nr:DNA-processing protein DprA [Desulfitibacter alkalitolerans]
MENRLYYLGFSKIRGIGPARLERLITYFGDPKKAWEADPVEWTKALGGYAKVSEEFSKTRDKLNLKEYHEFVLSKGIEYITIDDDRYPSLLKQIHDPPFILFYKGLLKGHALNIAIVGSRNCSNYGKEVTKYLAIKLAQKGINVISGMARGIDSHAHLGALSTGGYTTAVLGSGLDVIYPPENKGMFNKIIQNGLVISEYPPGVGPEAANFPARNRLISGLSQGVIVVEAAAKSGSLITVDFALEQGRDVFAVPGNITSKNSRGTNNLLKQGAKIITDIDSVLEEYIGCWNTESESSLHNHGHKIPLSKEEELVLNLINDNPVEIEFLCAKTGLKPDELNSLLTLLEVKGLINQVCGKKIIRSSFNEGI